MATKSLGINLINMYEKMVNEDFDPLISSLIARCAGVKERVVTQVKKDLGIYKLYEEQAVLEVRLNEIKRSLKEYEDQYHRSSDSGYRYISRIDVAVEKKLTEINAPLREVAAVKESLLRQIRLAGVGQEIKSTFDGLPSLIADLTEKFGSLPAVTDRELAGVLAENNEIIDADEE